MDELPAWYVDMLLDGLRAEAQHRADGPLMDEADEDNDAVVGEDDWDAPLPEWASAWRDVPEATPNPAGRD